MSIYWIIFFIIVFLWVGMEAMFAIRGGKKSQQDKSLWLIWVFNLLAISIGNILRTVRFAHIWINPDDDFNLYRLQLPNQTRRKNPD